MKCYTTEITTPFCKGTTQKQERVDELRFRVDNPVRKSSGWTTFVQKLGHRCPTKPVITTSVS